MSIDPQCCHNIITVGRPRPRKTSADDFEDSRDILSLDYKNGGFSQTEYIYIYPLYTNSECGKGEAHKNLVRGKT